MMKDSGKVALTDSGGTAATMNNGAVASVVPDNMTSLAVPSPPLSPKQASYTSDHMLTTKAT